MVNITPQPEHPIARRSIFPFYQLVEVPITVGNVNAGASSAPVISQVISTNGIPKRIYIFAKVTGAADPAV